MIQIDALPAFSDNYLWLLQDASTCRCTVVDPGDAAPVLAWLQAHPGWQLSDILVTHHHFDHVGGVAELKQATGARVHGPAMEKIPERDVDLIGGETIKVLDQDFQVIAVPGHTLGHIAYYQADLSLLFCGDTLFAAGCGRLFEGTPQQMHASLQRLAALPDTTRVYCTHEYTLNNLRFACAAEPGNEQIKARLQQVSEWREAGQISLPSTVALEKSSNPFLRTDVPEVIATLEQNDSKRYDDALSVFAGLRAWKDRF
ncbi:hydroxyacylglutathione hydrolase [Pseudomonas sp. 8Z]|uniref:hydroxyacylglutathione hydrolase n=1 Tax=Pseudomonas sp. 8Z TaxID=2653166 RepID=UPI001358BFCC|nr:hydroxyacylglutathione hydrolase [Pseudomonas sp. 8Z]